MGCGTSVLGWRGLAKNQDRSGHSQYHLAVDAQLRVLRLDLFSVQPLRTLCLCGVCSLHLFHHRDTEYAEVAQRTFAPARYRVTY